MLREDQLAAIQALVVDHRRTVVVKRTGWGKSAVYFLATRLLRDQGTGPTLLVSPLLSLMRDQITKAEGIGIRAATINSTNLDQWQAIEVELADGRVDLLLISPERLNNPRFRTDVLPDLARRVGLLVIDEAHCISDWGHDFRPDYRRLVRVLDLLPTGVPVLCCTATANDRVVADVTAQLGSDLAVVRGALGREGLGLHVLDLPSPAERLAWLAETIPRLPGTGIIYCLTIRDTERVAAWLRRQGVEAAAYSGETDDDRRLEIEQALLANEVKVVVATSALGMGFDKPDLAFVVHYQAPGSPIAYYQQVGRAGRALTESLGILLRGVEDRDIQDFFIRTAFPPAGLAREVVELLEVRAELVRPAELLEAVNVRPSQLEGLLKVLEVEGAVEREGSRWRRTLRPWTFDDDRVAAVTDLRRTEQAQMDHYAATPGCRMVALRRYLDDDDGGPCGGCDTCTGASLAIELAPVAVQAAIAYLRHAEVVVEPRKQLPDRQPIEPGRRPLPGRALSLWGDAGWGNLVRHGKQIAGSFDDRLVEAAAGLVREWRPEPSPAWVTFVPSRRHPELVADFARRLAKSLGLPCEDVVVKVRETEPQKTMENSAQQYRNVKGAFEVRTPLPDGPVLLVDDVFNSRWTITAIAWKLLEAGAGPVHPLALADSAGRST
jgi:ATP-dependent DNA helicase RecQ